jgi:SNF2 family DNA or RNA helicase
VRTYGTLKLRGDKWWMSDIPPHVAIRLKHIFPRIPKAETGPFKFPDDEFHCADLDWFMQRYPLEISAADRKRLTDGRTLFERNQAELEAILTPDYQPPAYAGLRDGQAVRPYQAQAVETVLRRRGLLLGDDIGLGKTYTAAALMLNQQTLPAAVVMQAHLQNQWAEKIEAFTTLRTHKIKGTRPYDLPAADVYLFRYSQVLGWVDFLNQGFFNAAVFDEVQELRTGRVSQKGQACFTLAEKATFRLGLSATPIYNYGSEIWNIMQAIDPCVLGTFGDFAREWLSGDRIVNDPAALGTSLREQHVFLRRTKRDVGQQVPPINRIVEIIPSDDKELRSIDQVAHDLALRTVTGSFTDRGMAARELDLRVRHATGVAKARHVAAYCRILLEADIRILLVGWHRDVYDIWLRELADFNPVMYTGTESAKQKDEAVRRFCAGESKLFIMSLRSGAGLDGLQFHCSTVIAGELDWSPKVHEQIIGRLDREGQTEQVTAIYLNCEDGSDPPMVDLLGLKAAQSAGIVDPGRDFGPVHTDDSRVKALARQYLSRRELSAIATDAADAQPCPAQPMTEAQSTLFEDESCLAP